MTSDHCSFEYISLVPSLVGLLRSYSHGCARDSFTRMNDIQYVTAARYMLNYVLRI